MTMFYSKIDNAVSRYEFPDGTEVAFAHDHDADNPMEDFNDNFASIGRSGDRYTDHDPNGFMKEMDDYEYALDQYVNEIHTSVYYLTKAYGERWFENPKAHESGLFEELVEFLETEDEPEKPAHLHEYTLRATNEWGHPEFRVVIDAEAYEQFVGQEATPENLESEAKAMVDLYGAWAEGSVYMVGITLPDGETEYIGGIYGDDYYTEEGAARVCYEFTGHNPLSNN